MPFFVTLLQASEPRRRQYSSNSRVCIVGSCPLRHVLALAEIAALMRPGCVQNLGGCIFGAAMFNLLWRLSVVRLGRRKGLIWGGSPQDLQAGSANTGAVTLTLEKRVVVLRNEPEDLSVWIGKVPSRSLIR